LANDPATRFALNPFGFVHDVLNDFERARRCDNLILVWQMHPNTWNDLTGSTPMFPWPTEDVAKHERRLLDHPVEDNYNLRRGDIRLMLVLPP